VIRYVVGEVAGMIMYFNQKEHKMQLQSSSHEQFLLLVRQLEEKCAMLSKQVVEVNEQLDLLSNNGWL